MPTTTCSARTCTRNKVGTHRKSAHAHLFVFLFLASTADHGSGIAGIAPVVDAAGLLQSLRRVCSRKYCISAVVYICHEEEVILERAHRGTCHSSARFIFFPNSPVESHPVFISTSFDII
jgi:hypothetical protein